MEQMMAAGMNIALLNMSFETREDHVEYIKHLRAASKNYSKKMGRNYPLGIAARLTGRKIRTGRIAEVRLKQYYLYQGLGQMCQCRVNFARL